MDVFEAMKARHSVRKYLAKPIPADVLTKLREEVDACNREGKLHIQLVTDEPGAFDCAMAKYGSFSGVSNYFVLVGPDDDGLEERAGYYGERLVLLAQMLGLNTCWVGLTFSKKKAHIEVRPGEKLVMVIALGYGAAQGTAHKELHGHIVDHLGIFLLISLLGLHPALYDLILDGVGHRLENLLGSRLLQGPAVQRLYIVKNAAFKQFFIKSDLAS